MSRDAFSFPKKYMIRVQEAKASIIINPSIS